MKKIIAAVLFLYVNSLTAQAELAPFCGKTARDRPYPSLPPGTSSLQIPIEHIIVIMQENHSFDNYFGSLNKPEFYGKEIDGIHDSMFNPDSKGQPVRAFHETDLCLDDPKHGWNAVHQSWNDGRMDGFARVNGKTAMGYYDETDLPFYYALANQFATADRFFCSTLTQTFPNRFFLLTGTSFGHIKNDLPWGLKDFDQKTIFESLNEAGISWAYYTDWPLSYLHLFKWFYLKNQNHVRTLRQFRMDLSWEMLPQVVFIDSSFEGADEHPDGNIQLGQEWVAERVNELVQSPYWKNSALFFTYDEGGGFFDHVPPPQACLPDSIAPMLDKKSLPGAYDRYGIRVPFIAVSPYAKHHYVSHAVYDHTSILRFIETKFNLPALTARDANADPMLDLFDFGHPDFSVPQLPSGEPDPKRDCGARSVHGWES